MSASNTPTMLRILQQWWERDVYGIEEHWTEGEWRDVPVETESA